MPEQPSNVTLQNMQEHINELEELIRDWMEQMERWTPYTWHNASSWLNIQARIMDLGIRRKENIA